MTQYKHRGLKPNNYNCQRIGLLLAIIAVTDLTTEDIFNILEVTESGRKNAQGRIINNLSNDFPLFQPKDGVYGLLTKQRLETWENEHKTTLDQLYAEYND